jgi:hypothetical protein
MTRAAVAAMLLVVAAVAGRVVIHMRAGTGVPVAGARALLLGGFLPGSVRCPVMLRVR